jgi:uncharacterized membrane protein
MKHTRLLSIFGLLIGFLLLFAFVRPVLAQVDQPEERPLTVFTQYPSRIIGFGEVVTLPLRLRGDTSQIVRLEVNNLPEGWTASFRGGAQIVDAVFLDGVVDASVDLRLETPDEVEAGTYQITIEARGDGERATLPLTFTIQEKLPPRLSLSVDGLPVRRGTPTANFTFTATLRNEGGEDLLVSLSATQPENIQVSIESANEDVTEVQLAANESKNLTIRVNPLITLSAGEYSFNVVASSGAVRSEQALAIQVVGEGSLRVSSPDGRLSANAYAGRENPLKILLSNNGTAPLLGVTLSSNEPSGWSVTFDQTRIAEIPVGQSVEVNATITPPETAIAGDYMLTINARPLDGRQQNAEFRITVRTPTLWGVAGLALIALAVGVVGMAVARFGRR